MPIYLYFFSYPHNKEKENKTGGGGGVREKMIHILENPTFFNEL